MTREFKNLKFYIYLGGWQIERAHNDRRRADVFPASDITADTGDDAQVQYKKGNNSVSIGIVPSNVYIYRGYSWMNALSNLNVWSHLLLGCGVQHVPDLSAGRLHRSENRSWAGWEAELLLWRQNRARCLHRAGEVVMQFFQVTSRPFRQIEPHPKFSLQEFHYFFSVNLYAIIMFIYFINTTFSSIATLKKFHIWDV